MWSLLVLGGLAILLGLACGKSFINYRLGGKCLSQGQYDLAVLAFEQTVLNHFPGSPFSQKALKRLLEIGDLATRQNDLPLSLQAYHAVLFSTASLSVFRDIFSESSRAALEHLKTINPHWVAAQIPRHFPNRFWAPVLGILLILWLYSIYSFIQNAFDKIGRLKKPFPIFPFVSFLFFFCLWVWALTHL
jgi:hypothetical protein